MPLAGAFRSGLVRAARHGGAFVMETGRPVSMDRAECRVSWVVFAVLRGDRTSGGFEADDR